MRKTWIGLLVVMLLSACQSNTQDTHISWSATKEEAIHNFMDDQGQSERMLELALQTGETVVFLQRGGNTFAMGEFLTRDSEYVFERTSAWVAIGNTTGTLWNFTSKAGMGYALKISKEREDGSALYNEAVGVYLTISQGPRSYTDQTVTNLIAASSVISISP